MEKRDLIIVGTGPAGLSAAIYAARYKLNFACIGTLDGGVVTEAHKVENYPALPGIPGTELANKFKEHAVGLGTEIICDNVRAIVKKDEYFELLGNNGKWEAKYVLLAMGTERRKLKVPGEEEFQGKGVSYCATCDAFFFKNKKVAVIGGGDSAVSAAEYLGELAEKVYLISRGELRAEPARIDHLKNEKNAEIITDKNLKEIKGENVVKSIILKEDDREIEVDGVFIEIGSTPASSIVKSLGVDLDSDGHILVDEHQKTSNSHIYAAGDITTNSAKFKQIITAASEGAISASSIYKKIKSS